MIQKKDTKQRLFEVMSRLDRTFKPKLNENYLDFSAYPFPNDIKNEIEILLLNKIGSDVGLVTNLINVNNRKVLFIVIIMPYHKIKELFDMNNLENDEFLKMLIRLIENNDIGKFRSFDDAIYVNQKSYLSLSFILNEDSDDDNQYDDDYVYHDAVLKGEII